MASKITAFGDKIVAKKVEISAKTKSGILLPDSAKKEDVKMADVVAVGKDVKEVKKGDRIFYSGYATPVEIDGVEYFYIREDEVYFKVDK